MKFVVSDDHPGLKAAIREVLPAAWWQRCYVHFLRNTLDPLPRQAAADCLYELRWMYERRDVEEARRDLRQWLEKWSHKYPKLCAWVEGNIEETWTFYRLPVAHHQHLKSTNLLERFNQELKRRTLVVRIFPDEANCLRLIRGGGGGATRGVAGREPLPQRGAAAGSVSDNKSDDEASRMSSAGGAAS